MNSFIPELFPEIKIYRYIDTSIQLSSWYFQYVVDISNLPCLKWILLSFYITNLYLFRSYTFQLIATRFLRLLRPKSLIFDSSFPSLLQPSHLLVPTNLVISTFKIYLSHCLMGTEFQFCKMKRALEIGCTRVWT